MPATPPSWTDPNLTNRSDPRADTILTVAAVVLSVLVIATLAGVVIAQRGIAFSQHRNRDKVVLAAANAAVADPFTASAVIALPPVSPPAAQQIATTTEQLPTSEDRGVRLVSGTHPGLYAGADGQNPCDTAGIVNTLDAQPDKAQAWAKASGIQPDVIPYYLNTLTPVVLATDTWVTSHRYVRGQAAPVQTVLQAGNAVMIDQAGVPRVQCACGNPLKPPANQKLTALEQTGQAWPGYSAQNVVAVAYTNAPSSFTDPVPTSPVSQFSLVDLSGGGPLTRKAGGTINLASTAGAGTDLPDPIAMNKPPATE